ncbi:hypothetical protein, partial [Dorea formicigenerans]|uniref:hypothetical protein n=1 Tax=Dorea formicigenerans TaxID=39486 RepID=UPI001C023E75
QGSRIGRCGWITSFLRKKVRVVVCYLVIKAVKSLINISGGDALRGNTRSHLEHLVDSPHYVREIDYRYRQR